MSITAEGLRLLNFNGVENKDPLFSGGLMFHLGEGVVNQELQTLGNEVISFPANLKTVTSVVSEDNSKVTDVAFMSADVTTKISTSIITEVGLSFENEMIALMNLKMPSDESFTLIKKPSGSTYIEWILKRTRANESYLAYTGTGYKVYVNPLVSPNGDNQGLLKNMSKFAFRKDALSGFGYTTGMSNATIVNGITEGSFVYNVDLLLMPESSLKGKYLYNTLKELRIGATGASEPGLFTVIWDTELIREPNQAFHVKFSLPIFVGVSDAA